MLIPASLFDIKRYCVPNALVVAALLVSLVWRFEVQGIVGLFPWLTGMFIPFILTYFFFKCRMLGASDVKLFSAVGSMFGAYISLRVILYTLILGAIFSIVKMIVYKNAYTRFSYFIAYVKRCLINKAFFPYHDFKKGDFSASLPMVVPMSLAVIIATKNIV